MNGKRWRAGLFGQECSKLQEVLDYFVCKPKVPPVAAVKNGKTGTVMKIFEKFFDITLKFSPKLPLKVHQAEKGPEKKFQTALKFLVRLT